MKSSFFYFLLLLCNISQESIQTKEIEFKSVSVDTVLKEKISIRAIMVDKDKVWYAGDQNRFGFYNRKTGVKVEKQIQSDSTKLEFRSIAQTKESIFIANIGSPAAIFKINKSDLSWEKVYTETHQKAFYDSMNFWNNKEGIAIGDPTENCLSILITRDGGKNWKKMACEKLPKVAEGEAAFAASNTNVCVKGNNTWIVSGGAKARVFYSPDKGLTWQVIQTPIVQGKTMTGIFTADFYNDTIGVVAGGDYETPEQNGQNKAMTLNGGKTWQLIGENTGFGYASCIQFVPESDGKQLVAVGATGVYYSPDSGKTWNQLSNDKSIFTIRFTDDHTAFAAGKDKLVRIEFKK